jgi:hypothetical protein
MFNNTKIVDLFCSTTTQLCRFLFLAKNDTIVSFSNLSGIK